MSYTLTEALERIERLEGVLARDNDRIDDLEDALHRIVQWAEAYPTDIFPEPDWKKVAALLHAGGITLDSVSAHCMRHVVQGVGQIAREALVPELGP